MKTFVTGRRLLSVAISIFMVSATIHAEVTLPRVIGNHMVLQRNQPVKVWGWAEKGEKVTVTLNGQVEGTRTGKDGKWMVTLDPMEAGGPYGMEVRGKNRVNLEDILVGDVWICSGQSNMEMTVASSNNAEEEIAGAGYPEIRLFDVPHNVQVMPVEDIPLGEWFACSPETVGNFSAVGYFFGRHIHRSVDVPIGLISTNWGGTNVETWTSREMSATVPEMKKAIEGMEQADMDQLVEKMEQERREMLESLGPLESGMVNDRALWAAEDIDLSAWRSMEVPGLWEDRGLKGVDGVVWFRRTIELTEEQAAGVVVLNLGAIDDSDRTWINGTEVGSMKNSYNKERVYKVESGILKAGNNTLVVRVEDTGGGGGFWSDPATMQVKTEEGSLSAGRGVALPGLFREPEGEFSGVHRSQFKTHPAVQRDDPPADQLQCAGCGLVPGRGQCRQGLCLQDKVPQHD